MNNYCKPEWIGISRILRRMALTNGEKFIMYKFKRLLHKEKELIDATRLEF